MAEAIELAQALEAETGISIGVVNARFAKPLDHELLQEQTMTSQLIVTFEDHVVSGGFGSAVLEQINEFGQSTSVLTIGYPDQFVGHGSSVSDLRKSAGLDRATLLNRIQKALSATITA